MSYQDSLVSIIIPTLNRAHLIGETLDSIIAQTFTNWECIIVDDGSTDTTEKLISEYIKKDSRFQFHKKPSNRPKGANTCRNYGFELSKGEFINWFDSDDIMLPNKLQAQINEIASGKDIDVSFCECKSFVLKKNKQIIVDYFKIDYQNFVEDFILRKLLIQTGSGLWDRNFVKRITFDETLTQSQDYDFHIRAFKLNPKKGILNEVLYMFRRKNESISNEYETNREEHLASFLKVKIRILQLYKEDKVIEKGIINNILSSLNKALLDKDTISIQLHFDIIEKYLKTNKDSILRKKWIMIKRLTRFLQTLEAGAYRFRNFYSINYNL
jgi:glycosyltransferase involved in cell wall biosynthesis